MTEFNKIIGRSQAGENLMPPEEVETILQTAPTTSVVMARATKTRMSSAKQIQPVLATLPEAYWVDGDTGLKQTTDQTWKGLNMVAEEIAVIVPIPDAVVADASINLWNVIRPRLAEAVGKKIDEAILFGKDKPSTWPDDIVTGATKAKNTATVSSQAKKELNLADATLQVAEKMATQGFAANGFVARPGLGWKLRGLKDANGNYYYGAPDGIGQAGSLFGYPLNEAVTGAWDPTKAELILADWSKIIVGIRQDITYETFKEGVISDSTGKVVLNLMQQDTQALRVVMRLGYQVANPMTALESVEANRYPAGVIVPETVAPGVGG